VEERESVDSPSESGESRVVSISDRKPGLGDDVAGSTVDGRVLGSVPAGEGTRRKKEKGQIGFSREEFEDMVDGRTH